MKTRTPLFLLFLPITVVSISSAETPNLSEKEIRRQLIMGSTEDSFPYLPKEFFKSGNREKLILVVSTVLKENSVRTTLQSSGKSALEGDEPFQYWSVFRALTLAGYLEIPDAKELIRPYTEFSDIHLRENALDALAVVGTDAAATVLWEAFLSYQPDIGDPKTKKVIDVAKYRSAVHALRSLAMIGGGKADKLLQEGIKILIPKVAGEKGEKERLQVGSEYFRNIDSYREDIQKRKRYFSRLLESSEQPTR